MAIILYLVPLPLYLAYYRCKTGTWISSFRSFNYLMVLWLKKIRRQIENKAAEIWKCQYTYTELTQNVDSDWHCFWPRFYVSFSQSLIPVRLMCFWPIVKVWFQGWRNEILYSLYKLQLNALGYVRWKMFFTHIQSTCLLQSQSYFNFFQPQMSFVQVRICPIFKH